MKRRVDVSSVDVVGPALSFADFVRDHGRSLFGTAYVLTGNADDAEELVQDTLARLLPKWSRVEAADQPVSYVRRSLVNRFVSRSRMPAAHDAALADLPERASPIDLEGTVTDRHLLVFLLSQLPKQQRAAIVMRFLHDLPDTDIALALGCRPATVRSLISRGVAAMRRRAHTEQLADQPEGDGQR